MRWRRREIGHGVRERERYNVGRGDIRGFFPSDSDDDRGRK